MDVISKFNKETGRLIQKKREQMGLSVDDVRGKLALMGKKITADELIKIESGQVEIPFAFVVEIAHVFHCECHELMPLTEEEHQREIAAIEEHNAAMDKLYSFIESIDDSTDPKELIPEFSRLMYNAGMRTREQQQEFVNKILGFLQESESSGRKKWLN